jgi:hypothetical protein
MILSFLHGIGHEQVRARPSLRKVRILGHGFVVSRVRLEAPTERFLEAVCALMQRCPRAM